MRDSNRLAEIRALPCCNCGSEPSQAAHSNFGVHGKGRGIKADDAYTLPMCHSCHADFDQYRMGMNRAESLAWFEEKLRRINEVLNYEEQDAPF